jgi:DNA-binding protein H-NS
MQTATFQELHARKQQLLEQQAQINKELDDVTKQMINAAREQIAQIAKSTGIPLKDLGLSNSGASKLKGSSVAPKYRHPDGMEWSGRGRRPGWLGDNAEQYKIQ